MKVRELKEWLIKLNDESEVGIVQDEGDDTNSSTIMVTDPFTSADDGKYLDIGTCTECN